MIRALPTFILFFTSSFFLFAKCPKRLAVVHDMAPIECEPRPGRGVSHLVDNRGRKNTICWVDQFCADLIHEAGVLERVVHLRTGQNPKVNLLDNFFWTFCLPGILKMHKCIAKTFSGKENVG